MKEYHVPVVIFRRAGQANKSVYLPGADGAADEACQVCFISFTRAEPRNLRKTAGLHEAEGE